MVPTFIPEPFDGVGAQLCPCNIAVVTAGIHDSLRTGDINQLRSSPNMSGARCNPALICQIRAGGLLLRGFQSLVPHVRLSVLLAGPRTI